MAEPLPGLPGGGRGDRARGSRLARGTKGQGLQGWDPAAPGFGAGGTGLAAGLRVQHHPEMAAVGGDTDTVPTRGLAGDVPVQC